MATIAIFGTQQPHVIAPVNFIVIRLRFAATLRIPLLLALFV